MVAIHLMSVQIEEDKDESSSEGQKIRVDIVVQSVAIRDSYLTKYMKAKADQQQFVQ